PSACLAGRSLRGCSRRSDVETLVCVGLRFFVLVRFHAGIRGLQWSNRLFRIRSPGTSDRIRFRTWGAAPAPTTSPPRHAALVTQASGKCEVRSTNYDAGNSCCTSYFVLLTFAAASAHASTPASLPLLNL